MKPLNMRPIAGNPGQPFMDARASSGFGEVSQAPAATRQPHEMGGWLLAVWASVSGAVFNKVASSRLSVLIPSNNLMLESE